MPLFFPPTFGEFEHRARSIKGTNPRTSYLGSFNKQMSNEGNKEGWNIKIHQGFFQFFLETHKISSNFMDITNSKREIPTRNVLKLGCLKRKTTEEFLHINRCWISFNIDGLANKNRTYTPEGKNSTCFGPGTCNLLGTITYPVQRHFWVDDFPFPVVGYVIFVEGKPPVIENNF